MPEFYLHYLWFTKQIALFTCELSNGSQLEIIDFGKYNATSSGPDFTDVILRYDGLIWCGSVEMHINSSDWYQHNHQKDEAYNSVVLHVVYNYNQTVFLPHGELLTLELKSQINFSHLSWFKNYYVKTNDLPCTRIAVNEHKNLLHLDWEKSAIRRLNNKANRYVFQYKSPSNLLYKLTARSFGGVNNQLPFDELTERLELNSILACKTKSKRIQLILITSGLREFQMMEHEFQLDKSISLTEPVQDLSWKRKGQRYFSHPLVRIAQFAVIISNWEKFIEITHSETLNLSSNWNDFIQLMNNYLVEMNYSKISQSMKNHLFVNGIVPYRLQMDEKEANALHLLLKQLPPEKNSIERQWSRVNQFAKNAFQSQGSIDYFNDFCLNFNCLRCTLGKQLLNGDNTKNNVLF